MNEKLKNENLNEKGDDKETIVSEKNVVYPLTYFGGVPDDIGEEYKKMGVQPNVVMGESPAEKKLIKVIHCKSSIQNPENIKQENMLEVIRYPNGMPEDILEAKRNLFDNYENICDNKINTEYNMSIPENNLINTPSIKKFSIPNESTIVREKATVNCVVNNQPVEGVVLNKDDQLEQRLKSILNSVKEDNIKEIDEKKKHVYSSWLKLLINRNQFINVENSVLYKYDEQLRIYKIVEGNEGIALLKSIFYTMEETGISYDQYNKLIKDLITEPRIRVSANDFYKSNLFFNCQNGILDLKTMNFIQSIYCNSQYFRTYLGVSFIYGFNCYDEAIQSLSSSMPNFRRFIATSLGDSKERARLLFEIIGYCLSNISPFKKIFICEGANDSGKSLVMKFITVLLTEYSDNNVIANLSLGQLANKFSNQLIESAKLICSGEIDSNQKCIDMSVIKKITGGDGIVVERKFCDPKVIIPRAKLLFNTNEPLNISGESTAAMVKRIHTLKFPVSIPESQQDPNLLENILNERNQIVTISIWALREVLQRGEFTKDPDYMQLQDKYIAQVPELVIDKFISEKLVINEVYFITIAQLQELYCNYCYINDYVCLKNNKFMKIFKLKLHPKFEIVENQKVIRGIGIRGGNTHENKN